MFVLKQVATINGRVIALSDFSMDQKYRYSIYDVSGHQLRDGLLGDGYSIDELPHSGIYIFHVYDGQRKLIQAGKICHIK